jgi:dolichol-phosphate mannosyltransferase
VTIQDADLEYDPKDYYKLLRFVNKGYKVVYVSRVLGKNKYLLKNFSSITRIFFNHIFTIISNLLNNQKLTDAHTCYKMFTSDIFLKIILKENDFSFCPEITTKIELKKIKIKEVPINYSGRNYDDGKNIRLIDGIKAVTTLIKYRFLK